MAQTQSATGRFGTASVGGVAIGITGWTATVEKDFDDSTDSNDYDASIQQTWRSQKPGVLAQNGTVSGNYDLGGTTDSQFTQKFKTDGPYAANFGLTRTINFSSGNFDFLNIKVSVSVPGATMMTFTADYKSNGPVTLY